jgi:tRNA G46 methylase TrmB
VHIFNEIKAFIGNNELPPDELFDTLMPEALLPYSAQHFAGCYAIQLASDFLSVHPNCEILDIGSGIGKFCLMAALRHPKARFTGIEYRESFVQLSEQLRILFELNNVSFVCKNILSVSLHQFNGFFIFNPFHEHRNSSSRMTDFFDNAEQEHNYVSHLKNELLACKSKTRLVTYYMDAKLIPDNFELVSRKMGGTMSFYTAR